MAASSTTILTLEMDAESQARFDVLRQQHYPPELNRIAAHLTLFHKLPATDEVREVLSNEATVSGTFKLRVSGVRSLGRGVAFVVESLELTAMHLRLTQAFKAELSEQDRQGFRPHVVVQNKVSPEEARELLTDLANGFEAWQVQGVGLAWWNYLGGPWERRKLFRFGGAAI